MRGIIRTLYQIAWAAPGEMENGCFTRDLDHRTGGYLVVWGTALGILDGAKSEKGHSIVR